MTAYYNEFDPKAAAWLRELIRAGLIPAGDVDERDVRDVKPEDLNGYCQCHFFAGIGGWAEALRLAGWPEDRPVWTASLPCQPFSCAGKGLAERDDRHLWPAFRELIAERKPATCFGEQVASKPGRQWLAGVRLDLEALGYRVGAADLCAACVGAPHIRQRLFWVADAGWDAGGQPENGATGRKGAIPAEDGIGLRVESARRGHSGRLADAETANGRRATCSCDTGGGAAEVGGCRTAGRLADAEGVLGLGGGQSGGPGIGHARRLRNVACEAMPLRGLGDAACDGCGGGSEYADSKRAERVRGVPTKGTGPWSAFDLIPFPDGSARRVEPGTSPISDGVPARVVKLRGYGNAIVPQVAAAFIRAAYP